MVGRRRPVAQRVALVLAFVASGACIPDLADLDIVCHVGGYSNARCPSGLYCSPVSSKCVSADAAKDLSFPCTSEGGCKNPENGDAELWFQCQKQNNACVFVDRIPRGAGVSGSSCAQRSDCGADLICWGDARVCQNDGKNCKCTPSCDISHPCKSGTCSIKKGEIPNGGGICEGALPDLPLPYACTKREDCPVDSGDVKYGCVPRVGCIQREECDLLRQNCPNASRPRCVTSLDTEINLVHVCVAEQGTIPVGGACTPSDPVGHDDCMRGAQCFSYNSPDRTGKCRKYCSSGTQCQADQVCTAANDACVESCAPGKATCTNGQGCHLVAALSARGFEQACQPSGTGEAWAACTPGDNSCKPGYVCGGDDTCQKECATGFACDPTDVCSVTGVGVGACHCSLFGTTCPGGRTCRLLQYDTGKYGGFCEGVGTAVAGVACSRDNDCAANLSCYGNNAGRKCTPLCDQTHPCASGSCRAQPGILPNGGGICL